MDLSPADATRFWPGFDDPAEEARFRAGQAQDIRRRIAVYAPLAIGMVLASMLGHVLLFPRNVWVPAVGLLILLMLLPLLASWWIARRDEQAAHVYVAMRVTATTVSLGVCLVVISARAQGYPLPYEGVLLVIMAIYLLSGLRARDATLVSLSCLAGLIAIEWFWPESWQDTLVRTFFGIALWLLGAVFSLFIERAERRDFHHREMLNALAQRDPLTGLLNRRGLDERFALLAAATRRAGTPVAVAIVDLDHFKAYNDTYGHERGDAVLVAVGKLLARHARRPLDIVARLGGEEFLLVWHDVDGSGGLALAEQVRNDIAALAIEHSGAATGRVTASLGVTGTRDDVDLDRLYRDADAALYDAKRGGRNRVGSAPPGAPA